MTCIFDQFILFSVQFDQKNTLLHQEWNSLHMFVICCEKGPKSTFYKNGLNGLWEPNNNKKKSSGRDQSGMRVKSQRSAFINFLSLLDFLALQRCLAHGHPKKKKTFWRTCSSGSFPPMQRKRLWFHRLAGRYGSISKLDQDQEWKPEMVSQDAPIIWSVGDTIKFWNSTRHRASVEHSEEPLQLLNVILLLLIS